MIPKNGAVFDLDGTLLDSMWVWNEVDRLFLQSKNLPAHPDYIKTLGPMGFHRAAEYTRSYFGLDEPVEKILEEWYLLAKDAYDTRVQLKSGAAEYLEILKAHNVRIGAATSNHEDLFTGTLKRCGIYEYFDAFTTTSEVSRGKNFPDVYLLAAERIGGTADGSAVYEDIAAGLRGAKSGGFLTVGVKETTANEDQQEIRALADYYIEDFRELL